MSDLVVTVIVALLLNLAAGMIIIDLDKRYGLTKNPGQRSLFVGVTLIGTAIFIYVMANYLSSIELTILPQNIVLRFPDVPIRQGQRIILTDDPAFRFVLGTILLIVFVLPILINIVYLTVTRQFRQLRFLMNQWVTAQFVEISFTLILAVTIYKIFLLVMYRSPVVSLWFCILHGLIIFTRLVYDISKKWRSKSPEVINPMFQGLFFVFIFFQGLFFVNIY